MAEKQFNSSLLDKSIDDIEDLPGFEVPVPGIYTLKFSTAIKVVNDKDCVEAAFEVISCEEQNDPAEQATKPGTKFSVLFQLENEIALGKLKELLAPISAHFEVRNLATLITETCKDLIIGAKVKRRKDKNDPDRFYADVSSVVIA
jgi:hypothetical protein